MQGIKYPDGHEELGFFSGNEEAVKKAMEREALIAEKFGGRVTKRMKIGRNDPCPCGSGKKFKKCCIEKMSEE